MARRPDTKSAAQLQTHMLGTYFSLRVGLAVLGVALPLVVWGVGWALHGEGLKASISAYYYGDESVRVVTTRDLLVGFLLAAGACLYLYKGYSDRENVALNVAGAAAALVALLPTTAPGAERDVVTYLHAASAVLFFGCLAYVSLARAGDTLGLLPEDRRGVYAWRYRWTGVAMVLSPLAAVVLSMLSDRLAWLSDPESPLSSLVFWVEALGVWAFAAYWTVKTREMQESHAEQHALEAALMRDESPADGMPICRVGEE